MDKKDRDILDSWYAGFDRKKHDIKVFRNAEHEEQVRLRLLQRIIDKIPAREVLKPKRQAKSYFWFGTAAAVVALLVSIALFLHPDNSNWFPTNEYAWQTSTAQTGKLLKVTLGDGSEIILNAGSTLTYPKHFASDQREVRLEGEAFFNVVPDADKPFIVNTDKINIMVLGTSFNIHAHPGLDTKVTVATGKVSVATKDKNLGLLLPNQQISYDNLTDEYHVTETDAELATTWQKGEIRLDGVSFRELAVVIENTWGISLETSSERLESASYKTTFHTNNEIEDIMKVISKISGANYRITNQTITLYE